MSCGRWKELWVERLYAEISPEDDARLSSHLAECAACREEFDGLSTTRAILRDAAPRVPATPRVVVLGRSARRSPAWAMAAGLAGFGLLAGLALSWAWQARTAADQLAQELARREHRTDAPALALASSDEIDRRVREGIERYLAGREPAAAMASASPAHAAPLTRDELNLLLDRYDRKVHRERANDLRYVLDEIAGIEARTTERLGETQQAIRYVALANDPRLSEK